MKVDTLPKYYMKRTKFDYKWEQQDAILKAARENIKGIKTEVTDGVKVWIDDTTWILFRSSQNAPEFRVFAESTSEYKSQKLLDSGISIVKKVIS